MPVDWIAEREIAPAEQIEAASRGAARARSSSALRPRSFFNFLSGSPIGF
ncbi:MAG: hypothetical protein LC800_15100 [Acidobacteria bacterium]|nr:hypothetical protein [Acidobacteriota bacterium]